MRLHKLHQERVCSSLTSGSIKIKTKRGIIERSSTIPESPFKNPIEQPKIVIDTSERGSIVRQNSNLQQETKKLFRQSSGLSNGAIQKSGISSRDTSEDKNGISKLQLFRQTLRDNGKLRQSPSLEQQLTTNQTATEINTSQLSKQNDELNFGKLNPVYYSKMNLKSNIFKLARGGHHSTVNSANKMQTPILQPSKTIGDLDSPLLGEDRKKSLNPDSGRHTYYLKTQNKNPMNSKSSTKTGFNAVGQDSFRRTLKKQDSEKLSGSSLTKWQSYAANSLERSQGANKSIPEAGRDSSRDGFGRTAQGRFLDRLTKNSAKPIISDGPTNAKEESLAVEARRENYLLPSNQHALKRARGKGVKNSLLRTVFNGT